MNSEEGPPRTAQIIRFGGVTKLDLDPDVVLSEASKQGLSCVLILGYHEDGSEFFSSSMADGADALWLMERLKRFLLDCGGD